MLQFKAVSIQFAFSLTTENRQFVDMVCTAASNQQREVNNTRVTSPVSYDSRYLSTDRFLDPVVTEVVFWLDVPDQMRVSKYVKVIFAQK